MTNTHTHISGLYEKSYVNDGVGGKWREITGSSQQPCDFFLSLGLKELKETGLPFYYLC